MSILNIETRACVDLLRAYPRLDTRILNCNEMNVNYTDSIDPKVKASHLRFEIGDR